VITDPAQVCERAVRMAVDGTVEAVDGSVVAVEVQSICLHGDTPGAVSLAVAVRAALTDAGVAVAPFPTAPAAPVLAPVADADE
jgi:UPF0271 protein